MKFILSLTLILTGSLVHARDVNGSECVPAIPEAKAWPIKTIYLHGLFMPRGRDNSGFRALEARNRVALEATARRLHFRIAIPVSPQTSTAGWREWNHVSLTKIENLARLACKTKKLFHERALIGFSNGGYAARRIAMMSCRRTSAYTQIVALGAPDGTRPGRCETQLVNRSPHKFPSAASLYQSLAYLNDSTNPAEFAGSVSALSGVAR